MYSSKEIQYKDNAFDLLKMIGAFIVLFSHSFRHFEITKPPVSLFFTDGATGVMIFFAISGFIIMPSWEKQVGKKNSYLKFLVNRCLRIIPPLWFSFVIITLANFILKDINVFTFDYLKYAIKYCIFTYGEGYGDSGISNGVLWTILPTVVFYLFTPLIYKVMKEQKTYVWLLVILIFWQFNVWDAQVINLFQKIPYVGSIVKALGAGFPLCFMYEFLIGSFLYFKRNTILSFFVQNKKWSFIWLGAFTIFFEIYTYFDIIPKTGEMHTPWLGIMTTPLVIIMAFVIGKIRFKDEMSYSIFLFHMVIVGVLKSFGVSGILGILLTVCITPCVAYASRRLIEEPTLKLKIK